LRNLLKSSPERRLVHPFSLVQNSPFKYEEFSMINPYRLNDPISIGPLQIKNRLVMAPMKTRLATEEGFVTPRMVDHYAERAKGAVGLIIVEVSHVHTHAKQPADMAICDDKFIPGLSRLASAIHNNGAKAAIQLSHPGRRSNSEITGVCPVAPSPIQDPWVGETPRELNQEEIREIIACFAEAAERAVKAGFDAIEIQGAHEYLLMQFFSPLTNKRQDEYGGSLEKRTRFMLEIIAAIRSRIGMGFPLIYRLGATDPVGSGGVTLEEAKAFALRLEEASVNCLHVSTGASSLGSYSAAPMSFPRGTLVPLAYEIKKAVGVPVIAVCRINSPFLAEAIVRERRADLVALGRPLFCDPHFLLKFLEGRPEDIRTCLACNTCLGGRLTSETANYRFQTRCIYNPELRNDRSFPLIKASQKKRVLIAGAGPAGMEAARVAALRGYEVVLCEKEEKIGGQIRLAATPPYRQEMAEMLRYYSSQLGKLGVEVLLNTHVSTELLRDLEPQVVIVANGSRFAVPQMQGVGRTTLVTVTDILSGRLRPKGTMVVVGGGQYALETAEFLAWHNCKVIVLSKPKHVATDLDFLTRRHLLERLNRDYDDVSIICKAKLAEIGNREVVYSQGSVRFKLEGIDMVVFALALVPEKGLYRELRPVAVELGAQIYAVGDCRKPRRAVQAIHDAFHLAREL
jgi:2,4-dienoyl-CoA reductase-like NADH-dependent reductase (Old Yellow Enzyme family)/thioredoxin reductase